ncbi:hypothetical protein Hanom_Chr01g00046711 [Helianthus anomalus]
MNKSVKLALFSPKFLPTRVVENTFSIYLKTWSLTDVIRFVPTNEQSTIVAQNLAKSALPNSTPSESHKHPSDQSKTLGSLPPLRCKNH